MPEPYERRYGAAPAARTRAEIDEGLRAYMLSVYNYMASGVLLTGIVAYITANTPALYEIFFQPTMQGGQTFTILGWIVALAPLGLVFFLGARLQKMSIRAAQTTFWVFAGLFGLSLASIFHVFTGVSIARVFFITAAAFGGLSLFGYTTKKDLSGWRSFLIMGLIGVIIASLVNMFLQSTMMQFVISVIGVLVFAGLTAYDTQRIKQTYFQMQGQEMLAKSAVMGALSLYLDFINMFILLLQLFGARR